MTTGGWVFMLLSLGFVFGLAGWSYAKLMAPDSREADTGKEESNAGAGKAPR